MISTCSQKRNGLQILSRSCNHQILLHSSGYIAELRFKLHPQRQAVRLRGWLYLPKPSHLRRV